MKAPIIRFLMVLVVNTPFWTLGCGNKIRFWLDPWIDSLLLSSRFLIFSIFPYSKPRPFRVSSLSLQIGTSIFKGTLPTWKLLNYLLSLFSFRVLASLPPVLMSISGLPLPRAYSLCPPSSLFFLPLLLLSTSPIKQFELLLFLKKFKGFFRKLLRMVPPRWTSSNLSTPILPLCLMSVLYVAQLSNWLTIFLSIAPFPGDFEVALFS